MDGGGIKASDAHVTLTNSIMRENTATNGGAVHLLGVHCGCP